MSIKEFFHTLWYHRRTIHNLAALLDASMMRQSELDQAIRCRDHALESLATPYEAPDPEALLKPIRLQRMTYREQQIAFERQNSARFRDMDEARRRKQAAANQ